MDEFKNKITEKSGSRIAVAFGGGGARGLAHIHVIETLDELGLRPVALSGSSIGALMGAGMAAGMSGKDIRDYTLTLLASKKDVASRAWKARSNSFGGNWISGGQFGRLNAENVVKQFLPEQIPANFEELQIPLQITGTDFYGHKLAVFDSDDIRSAIAASIALPVLFSPVKRDGMTLIDGGIYNPIPFDLLTDKADIIIGVDVVGVPQGYHKKNPGALDVMFGATQLMMQSIIATKVQAHKPDILLRPQVGHFRVLDFFKANTILAETIDVKDQLKRALDRLIG